MDTNINWVRTLRTMAVAALLIIALLGALLASIGGARGPVWNWACDHATPPPSPARPAPG
jgi:hypothetical protein